jgi:hypothetical protein
MQLHLINLPRYRQSQYVTSYDDVISQLNVSHVTERDGGHYSCLAENKAGSVSHTAEMRVFGMHFFKVLL